MPWADVLDQSRAADTLRRALVSGRVAHAYLLHGPDGVGKRALALAFAQALVCERGAPGGDACGACTGCTKARRLIHPDLHVLFPLPSDADESDVAERLQALAANPYDPPLVSRRKDDGPGKQAFYAVERMQEDVRRPMSYRPMEARRKVAILTDVDTMRPEAANAFLKLLEEPGPDTVFVLTTARPDRVLPTILSRCQKLRLDPLSDEAVAHALATRDGLPDDTAALVARMAGGSYARARALASDDDLAAHRDLVLRFFRYAYSRKPEQADVLDAVVALGRDGFRRFADLALRFAHDLVRFRTLGEAAPLVNVDQAASVRGFVQGLPHASLDGVVDLVEEARDLVERNVSLPLVVRVLAHRLGEAMHRGQARPLFVPLADAGA